MQHVDSLTATMLTAARQAGSIARILQGKVANEGKVESTDLPNDDALLRRRRAAKTVVDEAVQEIVILAASAVLRNEDVQLDAEESSESIGLFNGTGAGATLIIDPIDGTLEYLENKSSYSICIGLAQSGSMELAIVYFPARDSLYMLEHGVSRAWIREGAECTRSDGSAMHAVPTQTNRLYYNGRVPQAAVQDLRSAGYSVIDDTLGGRGAPDCILECLEGKAAAYVSHTRQSRDVLLGAILSGASNGYATDWRGEPLRWPNGGRVPRAVFSNGHPSADLIEILRPWS